MDFGENFFYKALHMKFSVDNKYHKKNIKVILNKFTYKNILYVKFILF